MNNTTEKKQINLRTIRYYLPALSTIGWVFLLLLGSVEVFQVLGLLFITVGVLAAFTVCPIRLMKIPVTCSLALFKFLRGFIPFYGVADLVAGLIGMFVGSMVGLFVMSVAPVFLTVKKLREKEMLVAQVA